MANRRGARVSSRAVTLSAAAGAVAAGAAAGLAIQRNHLRRLAHDDDYQSLSAPLGGRPVTAISADGTRLHAEAFGPDGGATVVLAHGWTEQLSLWGPVIRLLIERGLCPVAYDLRGHGRSAPAADHDYSLERFGEDVEAVLAAAACPDGAKATVVGHSLGAMSIAAWAEHHDPGARASGAVLVNTGLGDLIKGHLLFGELAKWMNNTYVSRLFLGSKAPMPTFSTPAQHAIIRYIAFGPTATRAQIAFYERMLIECPPAVRAATGVVLSDMDLWDAVARLTVPTLVIAGAQDRLTPPAHARRIADTLPELQGLVELPETGHMGPLERPRELAGLIAELATTHEVRLPSAAPSSVEGS